MLAAGTTVVEELEKWEVYTGKGAENGKKEAGRKTTWAIVIWSVAATPDGTNAIQLDRDVGVIAALAVGKFEMSGHMTLSNLFMRFLTYFRVFRRPQEPKKGASKL